MLLDQQELSTFVVLGAETRSLGKLAIATRNNPRTVRGVAHRVGYTHAKAGANAMYRLKIDIPSYPGKTTLPNLFVLDDGTFCDYDEWCSLHSN